MAKINSIRFVALLCSEMLFVGCGHTLFDGAESQYSIVVCDDASESEQTAAEELQSYLKQISGAELPLKRSDELAKGEKHIFVGYREEYGARAGALVREAWRECGHRTTRCRVADLYLL